MPKGDFMNEPEEPPLKGHSFKELEQEKTVSDNPNKSNPCCGQPDMGLYHYWKYASGLLPNCGGICTVVCGRLR